MSQKKLLIFGWTICLLAALFYCYEYVLRIAPSVIVPELMKQFKVTAAGLGFIVGLYYYAYTPMQVVVGVLIDRYGTRLILTFAVITCFIGSLIFSGSETFFFAGLGRFLIGLGSSFAFVSVLKLAAEWLPKDYFAFFAGFTTSLGMIGAMAGDIGLSAIAVKIGWKNMLNIGTIIGVVLTPAIWFFIKDNPEWQNTHKEVTKFNEVFSNLWQMVKNPQMWLAGFIGCALYTSLSVFGELWGIPFLKDVYQLAPDQAALACSLVFAGWLFGGPLTGFWSDRAKTRKFPLLIGGLFSATIITIIILHLFNLSFSWLAVLLFLFGIFSSVEIICFAVGRENNSKKVAGTAVSFINMLVMFGGMLFQPLVGKLLDLSQQSRLFHTTHGYTIADYQTALLVIPISIAVSLVLTFFLKETFDR
jgi:MFS family permease